MCDTTDGCISLSHAILFLIFGRSHIFIGILGFVALGLESTLAIPQLIRYIQSLLTKIVTHLYYVLAIIVNGRFTAFACLPSSVGLVEIPSSVYILCILHLLVPLRWMTSGWYTSSYNNLRFSSKFVPSFSFPLTSVSTMSSSYYLMTIFSAVIIGQRMVYGNAPPMSVLLQDDELEQALSLADE